MPNTFTPQPFRDEAADWAPIPQTEAAAMLKAVTKIAKRRRRRAAVTRSMVAMFRTTAVLGAVLAAGTILGHILGWDVPPGTTRAALCCVAFGLTFDFAASRWGWLGYPATRRP